ncbi:MFS transporter [Urbifossiella limnaea]|uniref:Nucleoside transporter YegT n=1 Tax=Urbifossiella limnaea TaxID=2528023 RepID=A0A517XXP7_9BACT|nr:MFS transporter [Urbifossiella limnaea]QDU22261.1 Putative nucleoside transporter YegT [Urbifossiella limnaea]
MVDHTAGGRAVPARLAAMMLLFYFGLGAWVPTLSTYLMSAPPRGGLNFTTQEVGWLYSSFAFGGMLAPLVIGLLTDRLFRAELVLGVSSLVCAGLLFAAATWCDENAPKAAAAYQAAAAREGPAPTPEQLDRVNDDADVRRAAAVTFGPLFGLMLTYCVFMQLAMTLTTVIGLRNLADPSHQFAGVRLYGTVGWILAGLAVGQFFRAVSSDVLYLAAAGSALVGAYAFTLPRTPPLGGGRSVADLFGLRALVLFRDRSFVVFVLVAFVTTAMNQFYVVYGHRYLTDHGVPNPVQMMTVAQVIEVGCMFCLPLLRPRDRMKGLMLVGLGGYALRGWVMAAGWTPAVVAVGVPMHGMGYTFFLLVASTYLDREAPPHLRASAQGIITFVSGGVGVWAGNAFAAAVVDRYRVGSAIDWHAVWLFPLVVCTAVVLAFALLFYPPPARDPQMEDASPDADDIDPTSR